ncbi:phosphoribosylanthranilate isomerase [Alsobacter sp. R-9]
MPFLVKVCGLRTPDTIDAAIGAGADMLGFVFFPKSPRHVSYADAILLNKHIGDRASKVALTVDATDGELDAIVEALQPDLLQLHGEEEPRRVADIRARYGLPVMKAIGVSTRADIDRQDAYRFVADRILFDAKPPAGAALPGGNGVPFDWTLLAGLDIGKPYMLSGGLDTGNVRKAVTITGAPGVDVSSGVERAPGEKDPVRIADFVAAARAAAEAAAAAPPTASRGS